MQLRLYLAHTHIMSTFESQFMSFTVKENEKVEIKPRKTYVLTIPIESSICRIIIAGKDKAGGTVIVDFAWTELNASITDDGTGGLR